MRLTVGPLPPAVYWRRRAVVLGAGLLFLLVLLYSCSGSGDSGDKRGAGGSAPTSPTSPGPAMSTPTGSAPTGSPQSPASGEPATGGAVVPAPPATGTVAPSVVAAPPEGGCTDAEMSVIPEPLPATAQRGTVVTLKLKIKNISSRTCSRDVGADLQEIYIKIGAQKIWSSDTCGTAKGSDVQPFTPGFERAYQVDWNGRDATKCADGLANGPFPPAADYQVFGRLGSKLSDPVKLSLVG